MLTTAQADHFATFGFAVLRGFLTDRAAALRAEAEAAIRDAYAATYDERVIDGISGHYLPMTAQLTPVSASLACDDPRFIDAAHQLLGGPVIPECPEGVLYFAEAAAYRESIPGCIAATVPGDVIAFDLHTWHASFNGRDRLAWTAVYQRCPETAAERDRTLRSVHDSFEQAFRGFDRDRYPVWRDCLDDISAHPRRAPVSERMRHAGVLDLPGALDGW